MLVLGFPDYMSQAQRLATAIGAPLEMIGLHRFPDGESLVRLPAQVPGDVIICRSLDQPNAKLIELMLSAATARDLGARHISLVSPYLCYMRQDAVFNRGEAVSQHIVGRFLADLVDEVVTVDPHLHRTGELAEAVPAARVIAVASAPLMGPFLRDRLAHPLLVGPDSESEQWVRQVCEDTGFDYVVGRKQRRGDRDVFVTLPDYDYAGREAVLVDDVASTGQTLVSATRGLYERGAAAVHVLVAHALFVDDALQSLRDAGVGEVWSTDSVAHSSNVIELAQLLADVVK
ncbi:MAG: ribose-phosphate diphosphokinase [Pseudomonadota bacterium]|nr:MAG: ribose-phosphate diphosphokinase [Pseudomonadota bacterium]